jgi:hypothetical protein
MSDSQRVTGTPEPLADREPTHPLSRSTRQRQRSLESYLEAAVLPRYMERLRAIHDEIRVHAARLDRAYTRLEERHGAATPAFRSHWLALARRWRFDEVNELIHQHNEWYPVETNLPLDPRTRDYIRIRGRSYRREPLGPDWILERFPA